MKKVLTLGVLATLVAAPALAEFPERPIQIIVPYSAGGSTDLGMRLMADSLKRHIDGATVVVRDQPGGGGSIGTSATLHARPDGYTLGAGAQGPLAIKPHIGGTDYTLDDVDFIGLYARSLQVFVACADAPFTDWDSFMKYAKEQPVQVGNSGAGGANQVSAEAFAKQADIKIESVPYPGSADARTACVGGHIQAMVASPAEALAASKAGQMTPIFVMEDKRIDLFPDTPTATEEGVDFTWSSWKGIIAPKGLPDDVRSKLVDAVKAASEDQEFKDKMTAMGEFVTYEDPETFKARAEHDSEVSKGVLDDLGMTGMNN
ncbi:MULTISPECIES: tripartite tricarboxylate transporter substrate binding protein [unclassified Thioclava]|uniref:Bug family tripartite tricarboxylate transporter substrate binding protein n=1 Tax=unclassified Thioclava TaxID=2621713 RepID=UPI000998C384|nr:MULTISPECIES: tripartite tricarboxylate transporter substrate binding protein [unclassified Thioclava]OOY02975.1 C4-dicarboxylate ABC transporter substrate-binding protein [Thioclava sp. F28-4]OWY08887.1 C4-dicarboxylate ABC transporter substrate-binding protein [Thioclava sp. F34-6]